MGKTRPPQGFHVQGSNRWYVIANRTYAIFYSDQSGHRFQEEVRLDNPEGRLSVSELEADKPGRSFSSAGGGSIHHSMDRGTSKMDEVAKKFVRKIAQSLKDAHQKGLFNQLVIASNPKFLGLLREAFDESVKNVVVHEVHREYVNDSPAEIRTHLIHSIQSDR